MSARPSAEILLAALPDPVMALDPSLEVVAVNPAAACVFSSTAGELQGTPLTRWIPGIKTLFDPSLGIPDTAAILDRAAQEGQFAIESDEGHVVVQLAVAAAAKDLWVVALRDVSEIDASHHSLLRAHRELEEFNRLAVGRELRLIELKEEVNLLLEELGRPARYQIEA